MGGSILDFEALINAVDVTRDVPRRGFVSSGFFTPGDGFVPLGNFLKAKFEKPSSSFWFSWRSLAQPYYDDKGVDFASAACDRPILVFTRGETKLFALCNVHRKIVLKRYGGAENLSTTGYDGIMIDGWRVVDGYKMDLNVVLDGDNTRLRLFQNGELVLDYTGDLTDGETEIDHAYLSSSFRSSSGGDTWAEIFAIERDTRSMALKTHLPTATRPDNAWAGAASDVATEDYRRTATVMSTGAPGLAASLATDTLPAGSYRIRAVKVSAALSRGETGPSKAQLGIAARPALQSDASIGAHLYWRLVVVKTRGGDPATTGAALTSLTWFEKVGSNPTTAITRLASETDANWAYEPTFYDFCWYGKSALVWVGAKFTQPVLISGFSYVTGRTSLGIGKPDRSFDSDPSLIRAEYSDDGVTWTTAWETAEYTTPLQASVSFPLVTDKAIDRVPAYGVDRNVDTAFGKFGEIFEQNPTTGAPWIADEVNSMGIYVKAKA